VPPAQHALDVDHCALHRRVVCDAHADVLQLIAAEDALLGRSERDQRGEVGALVAEAAADALEDADDLEWLAVDGQRASDRRGRVDLEPLRMSAPSTTTRLRSSSSSGVKNRP
jgi:hypothetical protein